MNGSAIAKHAWMSSFGMMVWVILLFKKGVGHVKKVVMHVGNVLTVMMVGCCDARNASSLCIVAMLCIALRYVHSLV
jgi:hypothetical protein